MDNGQNMERDKKAVHETWIHILDIHTVKSEREEDEDTVKFALNVTRREKPCWQTYNIKAVNCLYSKSIFFLNLFINIESKLNWMQSSKSLLGVWFQVAELEDDGDLQVNFLKCRGDYYSWPELEDKAWINRNQVSCVLGHPDISARGQYKFETPWHFCPLAA